MNTERTSRSRNHYKEGAVDGRTQGWRRDPWSPPDLCREDTAWLVLTALQKQEERGRNWRTEWNGHCCQERAAAAGCALTGTGTRTSPSLLLPHGMPPGPPPPGSPNYVSQPLSPVVTKLRIESWVWSRDQLPESVQYLLSNLFKETEAVANPSRCFDRHLKFANEEQHCCVWSKEAPVHAMLIFPAIHAHK